MRFGSAIVGVFLASVVFAQLPTPIVPGSPVGLSIVSDRCPTFLWTAPGGPQRDREIVLVVYAFVGEETADPPERLLEITLPPGATGWSPALEQCLEPGGRYAWSVGMAGERSEANLFQVPRPPSTTAIGEAELASRDGLGDEADRPLGRRSRIERVRSPVRPVAPRAHGPARGSAAGPARESEAASSPPSLALSVDGDFDLRGRVFQGDTQVLRVEGNTNYSDTALGRDALSSIDPSLGPLGNTAVGVDALTSTTSGFANTGIGRQALALNTIGLLNTAVGSGALFANTSGSSGTAVGASALERNTTGSGNVAVGSLALFDNTTGERNTAVGVKSLTRSNDGSANVATGYGALYSNSGSSNTAVGADALRNNSARPSSRAHSRCDVLRVPF
jgi:hypothetical protein